jgi:hypothetical protein
LFGLQEVVVFIEKATKQSIESDGSFRPRRVCLDSKIIETFLAHGSHRNELNFMVPFMS